MTGSSNGSLPGTSLLHMARFVFDDDVIERVIRPTIADLQEEYRRAGPNAARRSLARWRGYRAFWTLVLLAPVAFWDWPVRTQAPVAFPDRASRIAAALIAFAVLGSAWSAAGLWMLLPFPGGSLMAIAIHAWHERHPSELVLPDHVRRPEINLSAIPVYGDIGGLMFVVGSLVIVVMALPFARWFLLGVVAGGLVSAWGLFRWHAAHQSTACPTSIIAR